MLYARRVAATTNHLSLPRLALAVVIGCASLVIGAIGYYVGATHATCDSIIVASNRQWWSKAGQPRGRQWTRALSFLGRSSDECDAPPPVDIKAMQAALKASVMPASYDKITMCEDLGRACIMGGGDVLIYDKRYQPSKGKYTQVDTMVSSTVNKMHYHVHWASMDPANLEPKVNASALVGGNADQFLDTMKRYDRSTGLRLWPGGMAANPPVRFASHCDVPPPLVLFWDFPENYYHGMATLAAIWNASLRGGVDLARVSVAVGLPYAPGRGLPLWLQQPLQAMLASAGVAARSAREATTAAAASAAGSGGGGGADGADAAPPAPRYVTTLGNFAAVAGEPLDSVADAEGVHVASPPAVCYESLPVCAVSSFLSRPVPGMAAFMAHVGDVMLATAAGAAAAAASAAGAAAQSAAPEAVAGRGAPAQPFVTDPDGVLRITFVTRPEDSSRRIVSLGALLGECGRVAAVELSTGQRVPVRCEAYAFGAGRQGLADDVAKMRETDVLVGVHGAGLTNLGFLRPGATVVELRASKFRAENGDRFYRPMARDSRVLKWWGIVHFRAYEPRGRLEQLGMGNPDQYGRDRDVDLPWRGLVEALATVLPLSLEEWTDRERGGNVLTEIAPGERGN